MAAKSDEERKTLVRNRQARHDYDIEATWEAGLVLTGSEVKSLRQSHASIAEAYAELRRGEAWLLNAKIEPYPFANLANHEPLRPRKLLLHKQELHRLAVRMRDSGLSLVPLELYAKNGKLKIELGLGRGRKKYEKRQAKRAQEAQREIDAAGRRGR
jgi:SsrA-binding protein